MPKISALPAATAANLTGVAIIPTTDKNSLTVGMTTAQLRTALFAGGTGYTAADPLVAGNGTFSGTISGNGIQMLLATTLTISNQGSTPLATWTHGTGKFNQLFAADIAGDFSVAATKFTVASATGAIGSYNSVTTAGLGVPATYGSGRVGPVTNAASGTICTFTPAADGTFVVGANVLVTTATTHNFTVTVGYTDEGNTARVLTFNFQVLAGVIATAIVNTGGAVPYEGIPMTIRTKGGVAITIQTAAGGTYTNVVYNASAFITQIAA
jgi:hypothetical protein